MAKLLLVLVKAVTHQLRHRSLSELSASASHIAELPNAKRFLFPGGGVGGFCGSGAGVGKGGGAGAFSAGAGAGAGFAINFTFCSYPTRSAGFSGAPVSTFTSPAPFTQDVRLSITTFLCIKFLQIPTA